MMSNAERRANPRAVCRGDVQVRGSHGHARARIVDVSEGGVGLLVGGAAPEEFVAVEFRLGSQSPRFELVGRVVSQRKVSDQAYAWGIAFHSIDRGTRVKIKDYVARSTRTFADLEN